MCCPCWIQETQEKKDGKDSEECRKEEPVIVVFPDPEISEGVEEEEYPSPQEEKIEEREEAGKDWEVRTYRMTTPTSSKNAEEVTRTALEMILTKNLQRVHLTIKGKGEKRWQCQQLKGSRGVTLHTHRQDSRLPTLEKETWKPPWKPWSASHLPASNMNTRKMRPVGIKVVTRYVIRKSPNTSLWKRMDCSWKRLCGCPDEKEDKRKDNPDHHYLHDVPSRRNSDGDLNCQNAKHQVIASVIASHLRLREWRTVGTVEPGPSWGKDPKEAFWWCRDVFTKKLKPNGWKCKGRRKEGTYRKTSGRDLPTSKQPSWTRTWSNRMKGPRWWSTFKDSGGNEGNNPEGHLIHSIEGRVWLQEICYIVGRLEGWGFAGNGDWSWGESKKTLRMKLLLVVSEPLLWNEGEESIGQRKRKWQEWLWPTGTICSSQEKRLKWKEFWEKFKEVEDLKDLQMEVTKVKSEGGGEKEQRVTHPGSTPKRGGRSQRKKSWRKIGTGRREGWT